MKVKILSPQEAANLIEDNVTVASTGFAFAGTAEDIFLAIENRFLREEQPCNLTWVYSSAQGDMQGRGLEHLAHPGLIKTIVGGYFGQIPLITKLVESEELAAYNFPQGQIAQLYRSIALGQPGLISQVGLHTFVDPRIEGGKVSQRATEDLVEIISISGKDWLLYKTYPIDVAIIRATTADEHGNLYMEREALRLETLTLAMAAKRDGGKVIAQVEYVAEIRSLPARLVEIPGVMVDAVVVSENPVSHHSQTINEVYNPSILGEFRSSVNTIKELPYGLRKIIARRATMELCGKETINLGTGMPEGIGSVLFEEGRLGSVYSTIESGVFGGIPKLAPDFGTAYNPDAIIRHDDQFVYYGSGGIDVAFLGFAEIDNTGSVNVSKFGGRLFGCGGFIDISQNAKKVIFCGTFTSGGLEADVNENGIEIVNEGRYNKFVKSIEQITFNGEFAIRSGHSVFYITERCVFELTESGLKLIEIAPGIDLQKDILSCMEFVPLVSSDLKEMPNEIFKYNRERSG